MANQAVQAAREMNLFVCFFGDGPKWDNFVLTLAPPAGMSNFRPFRYGDNRVTQEVLGELDTEVGIDRVKVMRAILTLRFGTNPNTDPDLKWLLLPLREITVTHVDRSEGNNSVYFRAGPLFDFRGMSSLRDAAIEIPAAERESIGEKAILLSSSVKPSLGLIEIEHEREAWASLTSLLAADDSPVTAEARRAIYIRLDHPRDSGGPVETDLVFTSAIEGDRYGWKLSESKTYEMAWDHRVPALIGTPKGYERLTVTAETATTNLELADDQALVSGNYERHSLPMTARSPSGTIESLRLVPSAEIVKDSRAEPLHAVELKAVLAIEKNLGYRVRRSISNIGALVIVVTAALFSDQIAKEGVASILSWKGLFTFLAAAIPITFLKVIEERFRQ